VLVTSSSLVVRERGETMVFGVPSVCARGAHILSMNPENTCRVEEKEARIEDTRDRGPRKNTAQATKG